MRLELVTAPATEPVTLTEAKDHARISGSSDDALVTAFIVAAREAAEAYLGRSIIAQAWRMWLDAWPSAGAEQWWDGVRDGAVTELHAGHVRLPLGPVTSVTHVKTYTDADVASTLSASAYYVDGPGARIVLRSGSSWPIPSRVANGIEIQWVSGWANAGAVPETVKAGIRTHVASMVEHRGDEAPIGRLAMPDECRVLYQRHRIVTL